MKRFLEVCVRELTVRNVNLRFPFSGERRRKNPVVRQGRTVSALRECLSWLLENNCHKVVLESTGSYWIPIWNVLSEGVAVIVVNLTPSTSKRGVARRRIASIAAVWPSDCE